MSSDDLARVNDIVEAQQPADAVDLIESGFFDKGASNRPTTGGRTYDRTVSASCNVGGTIINTYSGWDGASTLREEHITLTVKDGKVIEVVESKREIQEYRGVSEKWETVERELPNQVVTFVFEDESGHKETFSAIGGSETMIDYWNDYCYAKFGEPLNIYTCLERGEAISINDETIKISAVTSDGLSISSIEGFTRSIHLRNRADNEWIYDGRYKGEFVDKIPRAGTEEVTEKEKRYTDEEVEMIRRAIEGDGITTGDTFYDSLGVIIPLDFARFLRGVGDAVGVRRGFQGSDLQYYPNYDYDEGNPNIVRLEQEGITEVMDFLMEHNGIEALNAYANGASWEESGMSSLNSYILMGFNLDGYTPDEINALAERMFWSHYIQNFGDVDTSGFSQDYGYTDGAGLSNYFSLVSVEADASYDSIRLQLMQDLKGMLALQLEPVNEALGYIVSAPTPVLDITITDDDYDPVSSNYYTNQLATYNTNYKDAVSKLNNIITKLTALYDSFKNSNGADISKIRNDLTLLIKDLDEANTRVKDKKKKTNGNAESCERCFQSWNTKYGKASINDEGIVYRVEIINKEGSEDEQEKKRIYASVDEMLNS